jgi:hypothetical protein
MILNGVVAMLDTHKLVKLVKVDDVGDAYGVMMEDAAHGHYVGAGAIGGAAEEAGQRLGKRWGGC